MVIRYLFLFRAGREIGRPTANNWSAERNRETIMGYPINNPISEAERVQSLPPRYQKSFRVPITAMHNCLGLLHTRDQMRKSVANDREAGNGSAWCSINRTNSR